MQKTLVELSTAHIPEDEADELSRIISKTDIWPYAFEGAHGLLLPIDIVHSDICPKETSVVLTTVATKYPDIAYIHLHASHHMVEDLPTFSWA